MAQDPAGAATLLNLADRYRLTVRYDRTLPLNEHARMRILSSALTVPSHPRRRPFEPTSFLSGLMRSEHYPALLAHWCRLSRPALRAPATPPVASDPSERLDALLAAIRPADFDPLPGREAYATIETLLGGPVGPVARTAREAALGLFAHLSLSVTGCWCWAPEHSAQRLEDDTLFDTGDARFTQFVLLNLPQRWVTQADFLWQPGDARQLRLLD